MLSTVTWSGKGLIPLWIFQSIAYVLVIVFLALALTPQVTREYGASVLTLVELVFFSVSFLMVFGEIIAYIRKSINVWAFFSLQLFKSLFWTAILIITIIDLATINYRERALLSGWVAIIIVYIIALSIILYSALAYSSVQVHRHRKAKKLLNLRSKQPSIV